LSTFVIDVHARHIKAVYANFGGIVLAQEEGENVAKALGPKHRAAILQNHGLLTLGDTVDEAMALFTNLDRLCGVQLRVDAAAAGSGSVKSIIDDEVSLYRSFSRPMQSLKSMGGL